MGLLGRIFNRTNIETKENTEMKDSPKLVDNKKEELFMKGYGERVITRTPSGGDYYESFFFDSEGNYTTKELAVRIAITEYTRDGRRIYETFLERNQ